MSETGAANAAMTWLRAEPRRFDLAVAVLVTLVGSALLLGGPEDFDSGWPEWAAGVGVFVLLLFRRRAPIALLIVALAWSAIHVAVLERPTSMIFAVLVLLATACVRLDRRPAIGLGVVVGASLYAVFLAGNNVELGDDRSVIAIVWSALAVGIADAVRSWRRYRESADAQVRSAVLASEAQAREQVSEERLTIARELHDLLAHNLSVMNVQTGAALHLLRSNPDQAERSLTEARDAGRNVLDELSELLAVLRHEDGDDAPTSSLPSIDELDALVDTMRSAGLNVTWSRSGAPRALAPAVSLAAYRIVQEALTNAAKHGSGSAVMATGWDDSGLSISVSNDAGDESGEGGGHGLTGMRERAIANGGRLSTHSVDGRFVVDAWLPASIDREVSP